MGSGLTPKQKKVLTFIEQYQNENGYSPSQQEIAEYFGYRSLGTVQNFLVRLKQNGFLSGEKNGKRNLSLAHSSSTFMRDHTTTSSGIDHQPAELPLLGKVAAGTPLEAVEDAKTLSFSFLRPSSSHPIFALQVYGDSMIGDGIIEGDYVIVEKRKPHHAREIVVASYENEVTLKRLVKTKSGVELHASNPKYKPIQISEKNLPRFKLEGVMVGLYRKTHEN